MKHYKELSKFEKLAEIQELNFSKCERHSAAVYLRALWLNDKKVIEDYERFGDTARKLLMNKRQYDRQLEFGFTEIGFDKSGWLIKPDLLDYEVIEFKDNKKTFGCNGLKIGRGKNGKWTYGVDCSHNTGGHHFGACIWGEKLDSRELAVEIATQYVIAWHQSHPSSLSNKVIKIATQYLESIKPITIHQPQQMQLF